MSAEIASILYNLRMKTGESQEAIAEAVGISRVAYTRYENGTRNPEVDIAVKLAQHFSVTVENLMGIPDKEKFITNNESFNSEEIKLIEDYRNLNKQGQEYIRQTMYMALPIYKRHSDVADMEKQAMKE